MGSTRSVSKCDYPGCGTELKPLFNSLYCPNEDKHGKTKTILEMQDALSKPRLWIPYAGPTPSYAAQCTHPAYVVFPSGIHICKLCNFKSPKPFP